MASKDTGWRTINGVHILIGDNGTISKGPSSMVGKKPSELKNTKSAGGSSSKSTSKKKTGSSSSSSKKYTGVTTYDPNKPKKNNPAKLPPKKEVRSYITIGENKIPVYKNESHNSDVVRKRVINATRREQYASKKDASTNKSTSSSPKTSKAQNSTSTRKGKANIYEASVRKSLPSREAAAFMRARQPKR